MNGKVVRMGLVLTVLMVACLLAASVYSGPITSGEHPWGSDRTGDTNVKPAIVIDTDTVAAQSTSEASAPGGVTTTLVQAILSVTSSLSMIL